MKVLLVAGPPSIGKTTVIKRIIEHYVNDNKIFYLKIDVTHAEEDEILSKEYGISTSKVYSGDLCPDHASVVVMKDAIKWAQNGKADILIVESAGLCLRCSPYLTQGLGIVVLSASSGINVAQKMRPMIALADIAVVTKIDLVSQAEKEILSQKITDDFPSIKMFETNALQGYSLNKLYRIIDESKDVVLEKIELKGNPPFATCTICVGKKTIGWETHYGVVRKMSGSLVDYIYRGD